MLSLVLPSDVCIAHTGLNAQWDDNDDNGFKVMIHAGLLLVNAMVAFGRCE